MAVDMFLKIDDIDGESLDKKHEKSIDVLAWSWGMSQSGSTHIGTGGGSGKVNVQDISFTKYLDKSTPNLIKLCCSGKHIKQAKMTIRKAGGAPLEYLVITLKDAIVSSVSSGGSGGEDRLTENVTLNFGSFELEYKAQNKDGSAGAGASAKWNIAKNAES